MLKYTLIAILLLALALLASCDAAKSTDSLDGSRLAFSVALDAQPSIGAAAALVTLEPVASPAGMLELAVHAAQLNGTKALYGSVAYDPQQYHLAGGLPAELTADDALLLCVDKPAEGRVIFGWVLANYDTKPGLSGDLELCRLRFASGAAEVSKVTAKAPAGGDNHFTISGSIDNATNIPTLTWLEQNSGDGDDNGEVNISDMTPLGQSLGKPTSGPGSSQARRADYDRNGEVNISDITFLGRNLGTVLTGFAIFSGPTAGSLTEQVRFPRTTMFPNPLNAASGELTWIWVGPAITHDTVFQVQPYDAAGALGLSSDNTVALTFNNPVPVITGLDSVTFPGATTWFNQVGTDFTILLTELSVDPIAGNAENLTGVVEQLQLQGMVTTDKDPGPVDGTERLIWYISEGAGLAQVSNATGTKGLLTFHWKDADNNDVHGDRGRIVVEAQIPGNFNNKKSIAFDLMTIDSLELQLTAGGTGPTAVNAGQDVALKAMGTFDFDSVINGNEYTTELTNFVNWAALVNPDGTDYSINTNSGVLDTTGAASGAQIRVTCEFPRTDNVTLFDDVKRVSNFLVVNIN
jgi:hypothetical protein